MLLLLLTACILVVPYSMCDFLLLPLCLMVPNNYSSTSQALIKPTNSSLYLQEQEKNTFKN